MSWEHLKCPVVYMDCRNKRNMGRKETFAADANVQIDFQ